MYVPVYLERAQALLFIAGQVPEGDLLSQATHVFVCGALQDPTKMSELLNCSPPFAPGSVTGFVRGTRKIDGREIPFMIPDEEGTGRVLSGVVWLGLDERQLEKIESLELQGGYRRRIRVAVTVGERSVQAITYIKKDHL